MRLLHRNNAGKLILGQFFGSNVPRYAILSHTWGADGEEVNFYDIGNDQTHQKSGWAKLDFCEKQATSDGLKYFWVDTCCIDKSSSAELTEDINSMFRYYREAIKCYVFLTDVSTESQDPDDFWSNDAQRTAFRNSRWFTRGWTIQELIAPGSVEFFSDEGLLLGDKTTLEMELHSITGIDTGALQGNDLLNFSTTKKMAWALNRNTSREEDRAYCLLGIFDVTMSLIYGEGRNRAFRRLEREIEESSDSQGTSKRRRLEATTHAPPELDPGRTRQDLLSSLFYPEHASRRQNVKPPWENTFGWIFDDVIKDNFGGNTYSWSSFPEWLRGGDSTYWINGKAGSGKSTLMSHIIHDNRLQAGLQTWSRDSPVHTLSFFFWRAGSDLQKSVSGMLRSLLYQLLEEVPGSGDTAAINLRLTDGHIPEWTERTLAEFLETALGSASNQFFCLFIDGLDEFEGNYDELLDLVFNLQVLENVKCCLSSRPETNLAARLSICKQLRLQDFNRRDIYQFVREKVEGCHGASGDAKNTELLMQSITDKATGVFLWASLVMTSVIKGLRAGDDDEMIHQRVESTPPELEALFRQMLASVDPFHKESLAFYLHVFLREHGINVPTLGLFAAAEISGEISDYRHFVRKCEATEKQILARGNGLLEIDGRCHDSLVGYPIWCIPQGEVNYHESSTNETRQCLAKRRSIIACTSIEDKVLEYYGLGVSFVHRSAYDFMSSPEVKEAINLLSTTSAASFQVKVVQAQFRSLVALPWVVKSEYTTSICVSASTTVSSISMLVDSPSQRYRLLDDLQDLLPHFPLEEYADAESSQYEVWRTFTPKGELYQQSRPHTNFWISIMVEGELEYVLYSLPRLKELKYRGIIFSELITRCRDQLRRKETFSKDLIDLMGRMLKIWEDQYKHGASGSPSNCLHYMQTSVQQGYSSRASTSLSWLYDNEASLYHDDESVWYIVQAFGNWSCLSLDDAKSLGDPIGPNHVEDIQNRCRKIMQSLDLHFGLDGGRRSRLCPLSFQLSAEAWFRNIGEPSQGRELITSINNTSPKFRIVCTPTGNSSQDISDTVCIVASHDIGTKVSIRLMDFLRIETQGWDLQDPKCFHGNWRQYLECLEMIIVDVRENVGQRLNAWQQLYILASVKTRFQEWWRISDSDNPDPIEYSSLLELS